VGTPSIPYVGTVAGKLLPPIIPKAVNLPGAKKIIVDMAHIASGTWRADWRQRGQGPFPSIYEQAGSGANNQRGVLLREERRHPRGRELIRGTSGDLIIEMYFNRQTKTIETAELVNA